jgi:hypothetical protein
MREIDMERFRKTLMAKLEFYESVNYSELAKEVKDILWHFDHLADHSLFMNSPLTYFTDEKSEKEIA